MKIKEISLYYKDDKSDKEYHIQLEQDKSGYLVNFQYGRRGSTLSTGSKTKSPISLIEAEKTYNSLIKEKTSKGYTQGSNGAVFTYQDLGDRVTGITPQLLNEINDSSLEFYLNSPDWIMEEKFDGRRTIVVKKDKTFAINKKGLSINVVDNVKNIIDKVNCHIVVDGELIGERYYIFDILEYDGKDIRSHTALDRYLKLALIKEINHLVVPMFNSPESKNSHYEYLKKNKKEGVVFKKIDSSYVSGRPSSGGNQLKFKFWESATVEVISQHSTKRSVGVCVYDDFGKKLPIGNITIPQNQNIPDIGTFVEVVYLYANIGGSLYQPKYKGIRDDQDKSDCLISKIKFKEQNDEDDDIVEELKTLKSKPKSFNHG